MNDILIVLAEQRLRGRTDAETLGKRILSADGHPCALGSKALHMVLFPLKQALGNKHRHIDVFMSEPLEAGIHVLLHILPDRIAVGANDHTSLYPGIVGKLCLFHHVGIPLSKIHVHGGDLLYHFFIVRHF